MELTQVEHDKQRGPRRLERYGGEIERIFHVKPSPWCNQQRFATTTQSTFNKRSNYFKVGLILGGVGVLDRVLGVKLETGPRTGTLILRVSKSDYGSWVST
ncbi:hypothetical protein HAX54_018391 [Datura stramonium]|uniref:Uncharacterized protein n=1 Tax=Datura stramonium TaxID=4076 RepID=A0ABS8UQ39_DATST|nr:hypothetical protein [Datura stramonium]